MCVGHNAKQARTTVIILKGKGELGCALGPKLVVSDCSVPCNVYDGGCALFLGLILGLCSWTTRNC